MQQPIIEIIGNCTDLIPYYLNPNEHEEFFCTSIGSPGYWLDYNFLSQQAYDKFMSLFYDAMVNSYYPVCQLSFNDFCDATNEVPGSNLSTALKFIAIEPLTKAWGNVSILIQYQSVSECMENFISCLAENIPPLIVQAMESAQTTATTALSTLTSLSTSTTGTTGTTVPPLPTLPTENIWTSSDAIVFYVLGGAFLLCCAASFAAAIYCPHLGKESASSNEERTPLQAGLRNTLFALKPKGVLQQKRLTINNDDTEEKNIEHRPSL